MSKIEKYTKHWSITEKLHETVKNPNIHVRGTSSYYSNAWTGSFEETVVRYLYGDDYSLKNWDPLWPIDQLFIGDYVCIAAEAVILMGGNHNHRVDWFSLYPFLDNIAESYIGKGDTVIGDGSWIGMRAMIMPGVKIGEGAVIAAGSVVTRDVDPYTIVAGSPASLVRKRFSSETIGKLLNLNIYSWPEAKFNELKSLITSANIDELIAASLDYDKR